MGVVGDARKNILNLTELGKSIRKKGSEITRTVISGVGDARKKAQKSSHGASCEHPQNIYIGVSEFTRSREHPSLSRDWVSKTQRLSVKKTTVGQLKRVLGSVKVIAQDGMAYRIHV